MADVKTNKLGFYAWYPGDFRKDTQHLTREERHAYRDILDEIFVAHQDTCSMPADDRHVASVIGRTVKEWQEMRFALLDGPKALLGKRRNKIYSSRLTEEIRVAQEKSQGGSKAAAKRWQSERNADAMQTHSDGIEIQIKNEIKKENKKVTSTATALLVPRAGAVLSETLRGLGLEIKGSAVKVVAEWEESIGQRGVIDAFNECRAAVLAAGHPFAYFAAIMDARKNAPTQLRAVPDAPNAIEEMQRRIDRWELANPRPLDKSPLVGDWLAAFEAHFGFAFADWQEAYRSSDIATIEKWVNA